MGHILNSPVLPDQHLLVRRENTTFETVLLPVAVSQFSFSVNKNSPDLLSPVVSEGSINCRRFRYRIVLGGAVVDLCASPWNAQCHVVFLNTHAGMYVPVH